MAHVDVQLLAREIRSLAADGRSRRARRELLHVDGCLTCRRRAAECGLCDKAIATTLAATRPRTPAFASAIVLAAAVGAIVVAAPLRGAALGFFGVFEPHTVAAVPLTLDEMRSLSRLPNLSEYAKARELRASSTANFSTARAAAAAAGFALREPLYVPDGIAAMSYTVNGANSQLLTFVNRSPAATGETSRPALPADIAGSTLRIDLGATVIAAYTTRASIAEQRRLLGSIQRLAISSAPVPALRAPTATTIHDRQASALTKAPLGHPVILSESSAVVAPGGRLIAVRTSGTAVRGHSAGAAFRGMGGMGGMGVVPLVVVQMPVPRIASTGVSVQRLAAFMLSRPGVPPRVAAAFGALGDLSTTLPIPIPIDKAYTQPVLVDGVQGVGIGDDTGIGAAVVWQKNGKLYGVFATRAARDVLAIANSLR